MPTGATKRAGSESRMTVLVQRGNKACDADDTVKRSEQGCYVSTCRVPTAISADRGVARRRTHARIEGLTACTRYAVHRHSGDCLKRRLSKVTRGAMQQRGAKAERCD